LPDTTGSYYGSKANHEQRPDLPTARVPLPEGQELYDGSGTQARINWEEKFVRGGVWAILSSFVPVHSRGRVQPNYAYIDDNGKIPFWTQVGEAVHRYDCKYILQLSHSGRQRDIPIVENYMQPGSRIIAP
jgi:2,4-dienoyl-CoA reductase-like NADH-dependent reductase (Old Yellow Enzyme family)